MRVAFGESGELGGIKPRVHAKLGRQNVAPAAWRAYFWLAASTS